MIRLVTHVCEDHGPQSTGASDKALVTCSTNRCGKTCAPEGVSVTEHRRRYNDRRRKQGSKR